MWWWLEGEWDVRRGGGGVYVTPPTPHNPSPHHVIAMVEIMCGGFSCSSSFWLLFLHWLGLMK